MSLLMEETTEQYKLAPGRHRGPVVKKAMRGAFVERSAEPDTPQASFGEFTKISKCGLY